MCMECVDLAVDTAKSLPFFLQMFVSAYPACRMKVELLLSHWRR